MRCYYCDRIATADRQYRGREATFDTGSEAPRCPWHWRFVCDHCGEAGHFMTRFYCPSSGRLLCVGAGETQSVEEPFWAWTYWWELRCPDCGDRHASLDRAEAQGDHPWQLEPSAARHWLSDVRELARYPPPALPSPPASPTDADADANWSANADAWDAGYDERGDQNRRDSSDAVLLAFLGDVTGQRVLDAGSGNGYLSRLLAKQGARMVAVENAHRFHDLALAYQEREPLPIEFHRASLSAMPFLADASVDAAVANYVLMDVADYVGAMAEISRVLKPGGRLVCAISHQSTLFRWHKPALDSPRQEDRTAWQDDDYFLRAPGYTQWGSFRPVLGFNRPLRDYVATGKGCGLALRDLEEPELTEEARRTLPAHLLRQAQRAPVSYVVRFEKMQTPPTRAVALSPSVEKDVRAPYARATRANAEAGEQYVGRKPHIAIVRGATLNHWEMQNYAGLTDRFDVTAFGSDRGSFDRDRMPFPVRTMSGVLDLAERTPLLRRWYRDRYERNEVMLGLGHALHSYDLVHTAETFNPYSLQALRATRRRGTPLVVSVAENVPGKFDEFPRLRTARRQVAAAADLFIALTERNRQWLLLEGAASEKIVIHPTGVDRTRFFPAPPDPALQAALGLQPQHLVVVTIGTLQWEKGYFELLAAATLLRADPAIGPHLRYVWVGRGPEQAALERQVREQGLADVIRLVPYVPYEDIPRYHRLADVFCLPSNPTRWIREQFGMVLIEAMACGKPVVGASVGGIPEVIGDAGTLTPPADYVDLAATLKPLLLSAERRRLLGELGRQRVEQHYDAAKLVGQLAAHYARLLDDRPVRRSSSR